MKNDQTRRWRGRVWTGSEGDRALIEDGVVELAGGLIHTVRPAEASDEPAELDSHGRPFALLPGMVDLHNHGGAGHSFPTSDAAGCRRAAAYHRLRGTTTMLASLVSADGATLVHQSRVLAELADEGSIAGIHLEGPFLSPVRCGAQDPQALIPADPDLLRRIIEGARGHLRSLTVAPEIENFEQVLTVCADHDVIVSLGHSDASAAQTASALQAASQAQVVVTATHLFNGMPPLQHRAPGIAGELLHAASQDRVAVELVADGVHIDDAMVGITLAAAPYAVAFVSDAMAAAGHSDGRYTLGGAEVTVDNGVARLSVPAGGQGSIAGGTSSVVDQVLRHARAALLGAHGSTSNDIRRASQAVRAASHTPARVLGLADRGRLESGLRADMIAVNSQGAVEEVLIEGRRQQRPVGKEV